MSGDDVGRGAYMYIQCDVLLIRLIFCKRFLFAFEFDRIRLPCAGRGHTLEAGVQRCGTEVAGLKLGV